MTNETVPIEHLGELLSQSTSSERLNGHVSVPGTLLLDKNHHLDGHDALAGSSIAPAARGLLLIAPNDWPGKSLLVTQQQQEQTVAGNDSAKTPTIKRQEDNKGNAPPSAPIAFLPIKSARKVILLKVDDIDWIQARHNHVMLQVGKDSHPLRATLDSFQEKLPSDKFVRINRSNIVQINRIKELDRLVSGGCQIKLHDGTNLTLSRRYRPSFHRMGLL